MKLELEDILINNFSSKMVNFLSTHQEYFNDIFEISISNKQPYNWRAAWLIKRCMQKNDIRVKKHIKRIIDALPNKKDGHQRELLNILLLMCLNEDEETKLIDICIDIWINTSKQSSVRSSALKMLHLISKKYPELYNEIILLIEPHYTASLSNGIKNSIYRIFNYKNM